MYVKASVIVDHPVRQSIASLLDNADSWFPHLIHLSGTHSEALLATIGFTVAGVTLKKKVEVELGPISHELDWLRVGVSWKPASGSALFPSMSGEFHLAPNSYSDTLVTVSGTYEPPLGVAGKGLDAALMHRFAEATFQDLAGSIAAELDHRLATQTL